VRIVLDPHDMEKHPLRVGLSMFAKVDIRDADGHLLPQKPSQPALYHRCVPERAG
jgi:membrane fusion protein (multidrug efflux system)